MGADETFAHAAKLAIRAVRMMECSKQPM